MELNMKFQHFIAFSALLACILACEEAGEERGASNIPFKLSETSLSFDYTGGEKVVSVTSNTEWSIRSTDESWLSVSPASGSGNARVKVIARKNEHFKDQDLTAKLVCTYDSLSISVNVSQGRNPDDPVFSISPSSVSIGPVGGRFSITVISDATPYEITIVDDGWLWVVSREGDRHTGETVVLKAQPNMEEGDRNNIVSVCTDSGTCNPVMVRQEGGLTLYERNHVGYRFTATWCGYCPYMDEAFHNVAEKRSDFGYVTLHASKGYPLYFAAGSPLMNLYGVSGFPTGVLDGWKSIENLASITRTANNVIDAMDSFDGAFPCLTGITVNAALEGGAVAVDAELTSSIDADLKVVAILMESGVVEEQTYFPASGPPQLLSDFEHDNVARALVSGSIQGDDVKAEAGVPVSLHWSTSPDSSWNTGKLFVYVGVFRQYEEYTGAKAVRNFPDNYIDNCRIVPVQ